MKIKKLWAGLGWRAIVFLLIPPVLAPLIASTIVFGNPISHFSFPVTVLAPGAVIGVVLAILFTWRWSKKSQRTKSADEVLPGLLGSVEEFCLILRPFGGDGKTHLSARWFGSSTLEQVIARAARTTLGLRTFAIVDQGQKLAPPGPIFMRASNDRWKDAVRALISRAHSIMLILPPQQDLRKAFVWEVDQVIQHELQTRTMIVLPPDELHPADYAVALEQACQLTAALEGQGRSIDEVSSLRVHDLEVSLENKRVHVIKFSRPHPWGESYLGMYCVKNRMSPVLRTSWYPLYLRALTKGLESVREELSTVDFTSRYPWRHKTEF